MTATDLFLRVVAALDAAAVPYMLTGSFASSYHGIPRATQDVDFVIAPSAEQLDRLIHQFASSQYYVNAATAHEALATESQFNVIDLATGWKIDFICRRARLYSRTEFERRTRAEIDGLPMYIASPEDVIVAKLEWARRGGSQRQIEDVAGLLRVRGPELEWAYLTHWIEALGLAAEWAQANRLAGR